MDRVESKEIDPQIIGIEVQDAEPLLENPLGKLGAAQTPGPARKEHVFADEAFHAAHGDLSASACAACRRSG